MRHNVGIPVTGSNELRMQTRASADMPESRRVALLAIGADATAACTARLARVAGTHGLLLDGLNMPLPSVTGVARWTRLLPSADGRGWEGPLRADGDALPFGDESFCAIVVRFAAVADPGALAAELARVLAPHGTLLVSDLHPRSFWHAGATPECWERALRRAELTVSPPARCGAPWPRTHGVDGMPRWLVRGMGGAWVMEAHRSSLAAIPLRKTPVTRRPVEHAKLVPGAHRQCA